jgi:chemotaxis protein methyltransferase CheR
MKDTDCLAFLHWALPRLDLHWPGFRKVHRQVCKRLKRRMHELQLADFAAYRTRLEADPAEWRVFDGCCHITISRLFRERAVFEVLRKRVLPDVAARASRERRDVRVWSAGCASGEEPYGLKILWDLEIAGSFPNVPFSILATDVDEAMLARARKGCFKPTSLREMPLPLIEGAFDRAGPLYCVKPRHRQGIDFIIQDLRSEMPPHLFDLVLCRYVAFTYFALPLQRTVLARMADRLQPNGYLVIGSDEKLPDDVRDLTSLTDAPEFFQKAALGHP